MTNIIPLKPDQEDTSTRYEVASAVNAFIARAGVSKSAVARAIGMAQSTFSRRTTGAEPFNIDELGALAHYFDVALVELITGDIRIMPPNAKKAPAGNGEGGKLPRLDSNQQPAGCKFAAPYGATISYLEPKKAAKQVTKAAHSRAALITPFTYFDDLAAAHEAAQPTAEIIIL